MTVLSWVMGSPVDLTTAGIDIFHDDRSAALAYFYLGATFIGIILLSNIFISIIMEAYQSAVQDKSGTDWKWSKDQHYVFRCTGMQLGSQKWFRKIFSNTTFPHACYQDEDEIILHSDEKQDEDEKQKLSYIRIRNRMIYQDGDGSH